MWENVCDRIISPVPRIISPVPRSIYLYHSMKVTGHVCVCYGYWFWHCLYDLFFYMISELFRHCGILCFFHFILIDINIKSLDDLSLYLWHHVLNVWTRFDGMKMNRKSYCEFSLLFLTIKINFQFNFDWLMVFS